MPLGDGFYSGNRNGFINSTFALRRAIFYFIQIALKTVFPVFRRGALPRGLRVTGSKLCRCRILAALWVCSRRHPVVPKGGRGNCKPDKAGFFPPPLCLPLGGGVRAAALWQTLSRPCESLRFHPKNPFLTPLPPFPRFGSWRLGICFFSVRFILLFRVRWCGH